MEEAENSNLKKRIIKRKKASSLDSMKKEKCRIYESIDDLESKYETAKVHSKHNECKSIFNSDLKVLNLLIISSKYKYFPIALIVLFNFFYYLSLTGCPERPLNKSKCLKWLKENGPMLVIFAESGVLVISILLIMIYHKIIRMYWLILSIINLIVVCNIDTETNFKNHGFFNRLVTLVSIFLVMLLYLLSRQIYFICKKGKFYVFITCLCIVCFFCTIHLKYIKPSCDGWTKGIGNSELKQNEGDCHIFIPQYCQLSMRDGWFDVNKFTSECNDIKMTMNKGRFSKRLQERENVKRIGYPRVEDFPYTAVYVFVSINRMNSNI